VHRNTRSDGRAFIRQPGWPWPWLNGAAGLRDPRTSKLRQAPLAILQSGLDRLPQNEETRSLREDTARLSRIVSQLLELARIESNPAPVSGNVELTGLVADVAAAMGPLAYERNVNVGLQSQVSVMNVRGTMGFVEAIVRNLLENAILYTRPGTEVALTLSASGRIDDRRLWPRHPGRTTEPDL
jgi:signal transduction histidine kinase